MGNEPGTCIDTIPTLLESFPARSCLCQMRVAARAWPAGAGRSSGASAPSVWHRDQRQ